jgi:HAD superfamily hydrolase (TIGR01509 family)
MMIKGIIFDMDGVIVDSNSFHYDNWNMHFKKHFNIIIPKEDFASRLGESAKDFTKYFLDKYKIKADYEKVLEEILTYYEKNSKKLKLKQGIIEALPILKKKYKIAMATGANRDWAMHIVTSFGITDYFDYIIAGNEVRKAKPEPEIFLKAAEVLKLKPEECIVIEDAALGIEAAKRAGMYCISIPDELTKLQDHGKADLHLKSITEINYGLLKKLGG